MGMPVRRYAGRVLGTLPAPVAQPARAAAGRLRGTREAVRRARRTRQALRRFPMPEVPDAPVRLLIGPVNSAGQGYAWARAAERHGPGVVARNLALTNRFDFPADYSVDAATYVTDSWGRTHEQFVLSTYTHVISESGRPLLGEVHGRDIEAELGVYASAGIPVALLSHGSDTRIPSRHAEREKWSPFRDRSWALVDRLEEGAVRRSALLNEYDGHVLVSTPDMLDDLPRAQWCPVVVDTALWGGHVRTPRPGRPVVVHVPSHSRLKGTEVIEPVLSRLAEQGVIEYRSWEGLTAARMVDAYREADIVVDQMRLGIYGVAACEGMAAGRLVVSHVAAHVRARVRAATGLELPIVEADPDSLEEVLRDLVSDPDLARETAQRGLEFVQDVHDGRRSADALTPFIAGAG